MRAYIKIILSALVIIAIFSYFRAEADVITMRDGREIKGIVVENYRDRVVLSTIDGEITLMKSDIWNLAYDTEEENLVKLGEMATERGDYVRAHVYYEKAVRINPNSKKAREGLVYVQGYFIRKKDTLKELDVKRRAEFEDFQYRAIVEQRDKNALEEKMGQLRDTTGLILKIAEVNVKVERVLPRSPAYEAGIRRGDLIVAVWGKLTGYMGFEEVLDVLLKKESRELKVTIERTVGIAISEDRSILTGSTKLIGATLSMEFDGLTASDVIDGGSSHSAGLKKGDLIVAVGGESTRYMPLKDALNKIRLSKSKRAKLSVRREVIFWRKGDKIW